MQDTAEEHDSDNEAAAASPHRPSVHDHCLVCYSDLHHTGITPCGHDDVCGVCHLRLRHLHGDKKCPMCKTVNERVIVDRPGKGYDEYPMWGDELGAGFVYNEKVGMFFPNEYYECDIVPLFGLHCTVPNCPYDGTTPDENVYDTNNNNNRAQQQNKQKNKTPLRHLQDHLRNKHRLTLCQLCVDFKRDFVSQLPRFTPNQLKLHLGKGDGAGSGFKGHPVCEFCRPKRFYDLTQLHQHLQKEHYKCHVCEKQGRHNQYFRNYASLERHFDKEHYLCHDVQCLAARFVVFENEIDIRGHELSTHGGTSTGSTKIQLEFRVRRAGHDGAGVAQDVPTDQDFSYGLDGQAFVPESLPQQEPNDLSHPQHLARTAEIRAQAEMIRSQTQNEQVSREEAFPSLSSAGDAGGLRMGWTAGGLRQNKKVGEVTTEQFPSLPKTNTKSVAAKIRGKPKAGASATAAAISSASWAHGASVAAPPSHSTAAFPPASFASTSSAVAATNRESNLKPNNFPALGGPSTARYSAADAFSKRKKKQAPGLSHASLSNPNEFPPPPSASGTKNLKQKMMGQQKAPSKAALENVLAFPPPSSQNSLQRGKATTEQMKASLGPSKYKRLKKLTKEFASGEIEPESFVDQAAALFDTGYADPDFWSFVPGLLESCPNEVSSQQAIHYMKQLSISTPDAGSTSSSSAAAGWSATAFSPAAASYPTQHASLPSTTVSGSKKKTAWNSGGATNVARAKARPGSVSGYAAQQTPQTGTATKFMAKEKKQQAQQKISGNKKSQKKKQKDELRALAFGK